MDFTQLGVAAIGLALGGFLKGATGAGAPIVAVPVMALVFDVPFAVAVFSVVSLISNIWQGWHYRKNLPSMRLAGGMAISGGIGAVLGSMLLAFLSTDILLATLALVVFAYIALRLARPHWSLPRRRAERMAPAVGLVGGIMQGAGGISAPVSITFLNAIRLERGEFIATISIFFLAMSATQIPALAAIGILDGQRTIYGMAATVPLFMAMPLGAMTARRVSRQTFDKLILALLTVIALRLLWTAILQ